jgi:hypothetical protein
MSDAPASSYRFSRARSPLWSRTGGRSVDLTARRGGLVVQDACQWGDTSAARLLPASLRTPFTEELGKHCKIYSAGLSTDSVDICVDRPAYVNLLTLNGNDFLTCSKRNRLDASNGNLRVLRTRQRRAPKGCPAFGDANHALPITPSKRFQCHCGAGRLSRHLPRGRRCRPACDFRRPPLHAVH